MALYKMVVKFVMTELVSHHPDHFEFLFSWLIF